MTEEPKKEQKEEIAVFTKKPYFLYAIIVILIACFFLFKKIVLPESWFFYAFIALIAFIIYAYLRQKKKYTDAYKAVNIIVEKENLELANKLNPDIAKAKESPIGSGIFIIEFRGIRENIPNFYRYNSNNDTIIERSFSTFSEAEKKDRDDKNLNKIFDVQLKQRLMKQQMEELEEKGYDELEHI